jgi:hypothetical protein
MMSESVTWDFHFPNVTFAASRLIVGSPEEGLRTDSEWEPRQDLHAFLERFAPKTEELLGENARFNISLDKARITMRERVVFHELECQKQYDYEMSREDKEVFHSWRMWQIELRPWSLEEKKVKHANGQEVDISTASTNELYEIRVNAINYLWAWLLEVEPRGQYGNAWVVPQVGFTEYVNNMISTRIKVSAFVGRGIREYFMEPSLIDIDNEVTIDRALLRDILNPKP